MEDLILKTDVSTHKLAYRDWSEQEVDRLAIRFRNASPFHHLALKNFLLEPGPEAGAEFPAPDWPGWGRFQDAYQRRKMYCADIEKIPSFWAGLIAELCSPAFLRFLEKVTGIGALIPDPYLEGGGLHYSGPGGPLTPHTDFHRYERLRLFRRVNVILHANREWREECGGCLQPYGKGKKTPDVSVVPEWGACVILGTDDDSIHGFSKPILGDRWRRSVAVYYYASEEAERFSGDADTRWRTYSAASTLDNVRLALYKSVLFGSRCFSRAAHLLNPPLGPRLSEAAAKLRGRGG